MQFYVLRRETDLFFSSKIMLLFLNGTFKDKDFVSFMTNVWKHNGPYSECWKIAFLN